MLEYGSTCNKSERKLDNCPDDRLRNSIYRNDLIICQIFILNLNMPNIKGDGAEETTVNNFYKTDTGKC